MVLKESQLRKIVKQAVRQTLINEGAWGYDPDESDTTLDSMDALIEKFVANVVSETGRLLGYDNDADGSLAWAAIGDIEMCIEFLCDNDVFGLMDGSMELLDLYKKAIEKIDNERFVSGWKDKDEIKKSIAKRKKNLKKYIEKIDSYRKKSHREASSKDGK